MKKTLAIALGLGLPLVALAAGEPSRFPQPQQPGPKDLVILYEHADFGGRALMIQKDELSLVPLNFNDVASSIKIRNGYQATFYEDTDGKGDWFTLNCPAEPIGIKQSDYCEFKNLANDVATGFLCELRGRDAHGCVPFWNDRISGVGAIKPADPTQPQGRLDYGHND